jgi:SAM-dependent methyltransferase
VTSHNARVYDDAFFSARGGARASADAIVPYLVELLAPSSVVDVGCGTGDWLASFCAGGVADVLGVDGAYVPRDRLAIPEERFLAHDLTEPLRLERRYDLAVCLEVAEHLPEAAADALVEGLVAAAPLVLFGAAIPDQRGEGHVNEQWQGWWAARFAAHGLEPIDILRRRFWEDERVEWWYVQNGLLYAAPETIDRFPALAALRAATAGEPLSMVHPRGYLSFRTSPSFGQRLRRAARR